MIACKQSSVWWSWLLKFLPCCLERESGDINISLCLVRTLQWEEERELLLLVEASGSLTPSLPVSPLTSHFTTQLRPWLTAPDWLTEAAGWGPLLYWDTVSVDLEPHYCPAGPESASISGTQSGPHPVIDGSHFPHKKCEKSLIDHGLKCPCFR